MAAATGLRLELCTLGGSVESVLVAPSSSVGALRELARKRFAISSHAMLCCGERALADDTLSLQASGLKDGEQVSVVARKVLSFVEVFAPGNDRGATCIILQAHPKSKAGLRQTGFETVARFLPHGGGYRCAVAEPLPNTGRHAVAFDFLDFSPFVAVGLHADLDELAHGPLGHFGWIGETPGGCCLYQGNHLRHNGSKIEASDSRNAAKGRLDAAATVALAVDHEAQMLTWTVFPAAGLEPAVFSMPVPKPLVGRPLSPIISGTNSTRTVVRIRLEDPLRPSWCSGNEPVV